MSLIQYPQDSFSRSFFEGEDVQALPRLVELFWARRNELLKDRAVVARKVRVLPVDASTSDIPFGSPNVRKAPWATKGPSSRTLAHSPREALDLEDGLAPHWNLRLDRLAPQSLEAFHWIRPRGLHLEERNVTVHGRNLPASLFDLYFALRKRPLKSAWVGIVIPKIESPLESRFWSDLLFWMEDHFGLRRSSLEICIDFETVGGCVEAEEILFELKDRATCADFDAFDYAFSWLKIFGTDPDRLFLDSDRDDIDAWTRPLVSSLTELCTKRGLNFLAEPEANIAPARSLLLRAPAAGRTVPTTESVARLANRCLELLSATLGGDTAGPHSELELYRSVLWQWIRFRIPLGISEAGAKPSDSLTADRYRKIEPAGTAGTGLGGVRENAARLFHSFLFKESLADYSVPSFFKHLNATNTTPSDAPADFSAVPRALG